MKAFYLLLLFSFTAYSQTKFEYIGKDPQNNLFYLKVVVHNIDDNTCTFWVKEIKPSKAYTLQYGIINCSDNTYTLKEYTKYDSKQKVIETGYQTIVNRIIPPSTIIETIREYVCR